MIARCANLPINIRNGKGLGGGRVVGWLPVVCHNTYHYFLSLMEPLRLRKMQLSLERKAMLTSSGLFGINHSMSCWTQFGNSPKLDTSLNVQMGWSATFIQPSSYSQQTMKNSMAENICIAIQSDIYVRCIMALVRGANSNFPCPVCLVPKEELCKGAEYPHRTTETMSQVYYTADGADSAKAKEDLLKSYGLRGVEVCAVLLWVGMYSLQNTE